MKKKIARSIRPKIHSVRQVMLGSIRRVLNRAGVELTRYEGDLEAAKIRNIFRGLTELAKMERAIAPSEEVKFLILNKLQDMLIYKRNFLLQK